jgi:hypothetical protein
MKTRAKGKVRVKVDGQDYTFRMSPAGITIRRKWARKTTAVPFSDLLAHAEGQILLPLAAAEKVFPPEPCGDCDPCLGGRPDQCAICPSTPLTPRAEGVH